jgi:hypothetical protein
MLGRVAAGAGIDCAPAAPMGRFYAALNSTVRAHMANHFRREAKLMASLILLIPAVALLLAIVVSVFLRYHHG